MNTLFVLSTRKEDETKVMVMVREAEGGRDLVIVRLG